MTVKLYEVGGALRDEVMGLKAKDKDYAVEAPSYEEMLSAIRERGWQVIVNERDGKPVGMEYFTAKATRPKEVADFVLCRKEGPYYDGRRPSSVEVGTIFDDLARRDFTINAMARTEDGKILDPYSGMLDIRGRVIRCVGEAKDRFTEDGLRMLRAIRFAITKDFTLDSQIVFLLASPLFFEDKLRGVSVERLRDELFKMFEFSTYYTLNKFDHYRQFRNFVFSHDRLWLRPTILG